MTDTTATVTPDAFHGIPTEAQGEITANPELANEQPQIDQDSDEQFQTEAGQAEADPEVERLAMLDEETDADKADTPLDAGTWGNSGHTAMDEILRTVQNAGLSTDDAVEYLLDAALARDPSKVDQKALAAKIGPRRTKAIIQGLETFSRDMRPMDARLSNDLYQHTNGPHALQRLLDQAGDKLPKAEFQGYILALGKGGSTARRAIESLQAIVSGAAPSLDRRVQTEQYATPAPVPQSKPTAGMTAKAYVAALSALHAPGSRLSFEARDRREAELNEARRIGRANGLH